MPEMQSNVPVQETVPCRCAVIWIDWYAYHLARFRGLQEAFGADGEVAGIELVGGIGVHAGLRFREPLPQEPHIETLMPACDWLSASKLKLALLLWRKLTQLGPELVLVPGYYTLPALSAAVWARVHGRESVLMTESTAGDHPRSSWKEKLKGLLIRTLFSRAVTGGTAHVEYLRQLGFPADRIARFYDVVGNREIEARTATLREHSSAAEQFLPQWFFLYVGRLATEKNVAGLLRAWMQYRSEGGEWSLVLAGDGPELPALRAVANQSPFSGDVHFSGHKSSQELIPLYSFAGCFVLPSIREPWGLVVNEAMAASLPVIVSSRCGCAEDLVENGRNGFIFNPEDEAQLTRGLHAIARKPMDVLQAMGAHSRERIAPFSPGSFGMEIAALANNTKRNQTQPARERTA